ncbi:glycoside hydrolase [Punctularia strigosozonata HHB-11173 SS5]|uniref:glycoside hydrolase n=1 Tax=Punctularia strigosozonata (strain HHB-11173) TaxID=741275 RepID=UPI0004417590|nr:glycoside hydrolase [Punctularia strigosozonata HHB-11173 SS5]EIN10400.1 glycoside hydrolase [Punctularia strigosozonata HHB-11173 SS5]
MAYYPDWAGDGFPPEKIDFGRFDWIDFAFALPAEDMSLTWDDSDSAPTLLDRLVEHAHTAGKKVKLSIGGWTGSKYFSPSVSTPENRQTFASNIAALYAKHNVDGLDFDWEYPSQHGADGNIVSPSDTANFLAFLRILRPMLPAAAKLSAAVLPEPFAGPDGEPLADVSAFAEVLDWVLIMNYDVWGSSAEPGPNAPLGDACGNSTQPHASAHAAVAQWTAAGFPADQLVLGLPSYGYVSQSSAERLRQRAVTLKTEDGGEGQIQFRDLIRQGALALAAPTTDPSAPEYKAKFVGTGGYTRYWDECSATPYLRSEKAGQVVTFDDPESIGLKAAFAKEAEMLGVNMFDVHGDTDRWDLIDAARDGLKL